MKYITGVTILAVMMGCGILNVIFDVPENYVHRDVQNNELVGTWKITPQSETDLKQFLHDFSGWGSNAPWETIKLNNDGTCEVKLIPDWLSKEGGWDYTENVLINNMLSCTWQQSSSLWYPEDHVAKGIQFNLKYADYSINYFYLYVNEAEGEMVLWTFYGDADDFNSQEYKKAPMPSLLIKGQNTISK
jgi:hypothetical protein